MLRLAMTDHLFAEPEKGIVIHTAASQMLGGNPLLAAWVGVMAKENWKPMTEVASALGRYPGSGEPLESAYAMAHNLSEDAFAVISRDPPRLKQFADAMTFLHSDPGFGPQHLIDNYDFGPLGEGLFVDIGGSYGPVSIALAQAYPKLRFIVQDRPETADGGREQLPPELKDRVSFMAYDFFSTQPVKHADIYYYRWIFHDWSDAYCIKLLRALIPALKTGSKVLINDICLPPPNIISPYKERLLRGIDIVMKAFSNAKERDADEWEALFAKADSRFVLKGVNLPPGARCAIVEAEWQP